MDISRVDVKAFLHKVHQTDRLIPLSANMQHIDSVFVLSEAVCTMHDQEPDQRKVAVERGEMERSERIFAL